MEVYMDIRDHIQKDPDKFNKKLPDILVEDDKKSPQRSEMKEYRTGLSDPSAAPTQ